MNRPFVLVVDDEPQIRRLLAITLEAAGYQVMAAVTGQEGLVLAAQHRPELVILDEPFSGLDPVNQQSLERLIRGLADRGATVVFSTHVMAHAERLCDKVVLMARGRKVFDGPVAAARAAVPQRLILVGQIDPERVRTLPGVTSVAQELSADGPSLVVDLAAGASTNAALKEAFVQGLEITRFEAREPTLHDAFIVLTRDAPETQA